MKKKIPLWGLFISLGLILSYIESLVPFFLGIPGMKLGLCNALVVFLMYVDTPRNAFLINFLRILLAGFMFGNPFSIAYSLAGAALSFAVMLLLLYSNLFKVTTISIMGGMAHNIGQIILAAVIMNNEYLVWYLPQLIVCGAVTGLLIGIISQELIYRLGRYIDVRLS